MAKLLRRLFDDSANFLISSITFLAVVSAEKKIKLMGSEHHSIGRERKREREGGRKREKTFLCLRCGDIDQRRDGRQHCLLIPTAQTLDTKLHPIILNKILHVGWIQAAVTYPSHSILYHFVVCLLSNDIKEQVKDVELPEVIIVDGIVGKVSQVSQHLQLEFCMI